MNTEEDTVRLLRQTPINQLLEINRDWFANMEDHRDWYEILKENHWSLADWDIYLNNQLYQNWVERENRR